MTSTRSTASIAVRIYELATYYIVVLRRTPVFACLLVDISGAIYVSEPGVPPRESKHLGIWERRVKNGKTSFVRRMDMIQDWYNWANVSRIEAKGSKRRILLIGESVARGYLYDPDFTPALALQMMLDAQFGEGEVEIIDLARIGISYKVRELALAALRLEPDMAIIFAGNNWNVSAPLFANMRLPNFFPVFGEIHSFTAANGQAVPADIPVAQAAAVV